MIRELLSKLFPIRNRGKRIRRYEILLPLRYNDGTLIEVEKLNQTANELCDLFGGITEDIVRVTGKWIYKGTRYRDELFRMRIETDDPHGRSFFRNAKEQ